MSETKIKNSGKVDNLSKLVNCNFCHECLNSIYIFSSVPSIRSHSVWGHVGCFWLMTDYFPEFRYSFKKRRNVSAVVDVKMSRLLEKVYTRKWVKSTETENCPWGLLHAPFCSPCLEEYLYQGCHCKEMKFICQD